MSAPPEPAMTPEMVEVLIRLADPAEQAAYLADAGLLTGEALAELIDLATRFMGRQPGQARQISLIFEQPAVIAAEPSLTPRARYLRAQSHAVDGELAVARPLILAARDGFQALGQTVEALRTNIGLMHVLGELGQYGEALAAGQQVLESLADPTATMPPPSVEILRGLAQQNRGICLEHLGRYDEAIAAYEEAETSFRTLDMADHIGHVENNRGIIMLNTGRCSAALTAFQAAATQFEQAGDNVWLAQSLINSGDAQLLLGQYGQGLDTLRQARRLLEGAGALAEQHVLLLDTAYAYLALNLLPEAAAAFDEASALFAANGMAFYQARAQAGLGAALASLNRHEEAMAALSAASNLFAAAGNTPLLAGVLLEQAALLSQGGKRGQALQVAQQATDLLATGGAADLWPVQRFYAQLRLADLLLPDAAAALPHLQVARAIADQLGLPHLRFRVYQRLGHLALLQENWEGAQTSLETAVAEIEQMRSTLVLETTRASFLHDKVAAYEDLVQLYLRPGDEASLYRAFTLAEQAKSRALVDLLKGLVTAQPELANDPATSERLARLQADLNAIYNQVLADGQRTDEPVNGERKVSLESLGLQAAALEQEINRLRLDTVVLAAPSDHHVPPVAGMTAALPLADLENRLPTGRTLLAYHSLGNELLAFVYRQGRLHVQRNLTTVSTVQTLLGRLAMQWDRFRAGSPFIDRNMHLLDRSTQRVLAELHQALVAPMEEYFPAGDETVHLIIVPHGVLHHIPFHALHDGRSYLVDRYEITYSPSATALALGQAWQPRRDGQALVMGVTDPRIPAVSQEVHAVAATLGTTAWLNESATLAHLKDAAETSDVLHLACHGLFRSDNPMFSALKLHDGWLLASEALALKLNGAMVTLSACESGRSQILGGDELLGLSRAFLGAGAAALVASLWLVADDKTARLMADFYRHLGQGQPPATALRTAQLALKEQYPHPYYWAPFLVMGGV